MVVNPKRPQLFPTHCRCGQPLDFSCEDIQTGQPAEGADYWCSDPRPEMGPHDWGVVFYNNDPPRSGTATVLS